ncbi:MAG: GHMP kinase [Acidimicrobiia bacterium]
MSSEGWAPGRLDLLGGVADYSGSLVLEVPTALGTTVTATPADALVVGDVVLSPPDVTALATRPYEEIRAALAPHPRWTHYLLGVALGLVRHGVIAPPSVALTVASDLPQSVGVSSSASLEVATARALGGDAIDPLELALLCQEAENHVVGAPCGVMDQVTVAVGRPGAVLPILCRPASVGASIEIPEGVEVVGWPTGAEHDVSGVPYGRARVAAFMGKRMAEEALGHRVDWISELPSHAVAELPEAIDGVAFLDGWGPTADTVTVVDPDLTYPVRAATTFGVEEHLRTTEATAALAGGDVGRVGELMLESHAGYDAMGLGHPAATAAQEAVLARPGVHGARSSGGGSGGTVVVLCERGALDDVPDLIR